MTFPVWGTELWMEALWENWVPIHPAPQKPTLHLHKGIGSPLSSVCHNFWSFNRTKMLKIGPSCTKILYQKKSIKIKTKNIPTCSHWLKPWPKFSIFPKKVQASMPQNSVHPLQPTLRGSALFPLSSSNPGETHIPREWEVRELL